VPGVPPFGLGLNARDDAVGRIRDRAADAMGRRLWDRRLEDANLLLARYGQPPLSTLFEMLERPDRVLVLTSAAFEIGGGRMVPEHVVYCGPRLEDPDWTGEWTEPQGSDPLVLVSLSTTTQNQERMIGNILGALGRLPVRGLVTTGPSFDPEGLDVPANVTLVDSAPHSLVMPRCDAVITHAGHGTVIKSLANGVPVLCMPVGRDQPDTAARVAASGAGLRLRPGSGQRPIAAGVKRLLSEPGFRESAERMASAIAKDRERDLAVEEIERLATRFTGEDGSRPTS
jgi:MGT family glycosyltransferase